MKLKKKKRSRGLMQKSKLLLTAVDGSGNNNCNAMRTGANTIEPCACVGHRASRMNGGWMCWSRSRLFSVACIANQIRSRIRVSVFYDSLLSATGALASFAMNANNDRYSKLGEEYFFLISFSKCCKMLKFVVSKWER